VDYHVISIFPKQSLKTELFSDMFAGIS